MHVRKPGTSHCVVFNVHTQRDSSGACAIRLFAVHFRLRQFLGARRTNGLECLRLDVKRVGVVEA